MVALAEVAEISGGITKNAKRSALPIQRPYLSVANVHFNRIDTNNLSNIGVNEAELARAQLMPGDLMVVEGNGSLSQLGRVAIWHGQDSGCLHQNHLIKVRPKPTVKSKWLLYWLMSSAGREAIEATASSTSGLHTLSLAKVGSLPAPIASLEEQEATIAYIDLHLSRLDEAITTLQGIQAKLKQARASILKAAVEGRLVEREAELADQSGKSYEHANQQLERIGLELGRASARLYSQQGAGLLSEEILLPQGWARCTLGDIGRWTSGGTPSRRNPAYFGGGIPWVKTGELNDSVVRSSEETISDEGIRNSAAKVFPSGTLLVAMYGATIGMTGILSIDASTNQACAALLPTSGNIESMRYFQLFLQSQRRELREAGQGGAQPNISQGILKDWILLLPPIAEQYRIVAEVDRRFSVLDQVQATVTASLARCGLLRQAILRKAFIYTR
jgi:type I restriction enzyme S subunit